MNQDPEFTKPCSHCGHPHYYSKLGGYCCNGGCGCKRKFVTHPGDPVCRAVHVLSGTDTGLDCGHVSDAWWSEVETQKTFCYTCANRAGILTARQWHTSQKLARQIL